MILPNYQDLYPLILKFSTQKRTPQEYLQYIASELKFTEEQLAYRGSSGQTIIISRVSWALAYLYKAQLLSKPARGVYEITERGKVFLSKHPNGFKNKELAQFPEFKQFLKQDILSEADVPNLIATPVLELTPIERIEQANAELNDELKRALLERILEQSPSFFEYLVVTLLSKMGYGSEGTLSKAIGKSGDGGIDGIIHQDKLGIDIVYIQAKRYDAQNLIGRPDLQAFVGSLLGHQSIKGVFVTTSSFSKPALEYLKTIQTRIIPIDGRRLVELMIEHDVGTRVVQTLKINKIDEDFFME